MKYIIEIEPISGTDLYKAKGFSTLVFNDNGLSKLKPYEEESNQLDLVEGCIIRTPNGTTLYEFKSYSNDGQLNAINKSNGKFVCLKPKYVIVKRPETEDNQEILLKDIAIKICNKYGYVYKFYDDGRIAINDILSCGESLTTDWIGKCECDCGHYEYLTIKDFLFDWLEDVKSDKNDSFAKEIITFIENLKNSDMDEYIKRQDAINTVSTSYKYESDRLTALQDIPSKTKKEIAKDEIINFAVTVLAEVAEFAKQKGSPIYEGDKEVDKWVRLSDVNAAINKHLNKNESELNWQ